MEHYELRSLQDVPGVVGHVAASQVLTPIVERLDLDDGPWSALLERSFGLAAQIG
jgi:hypothetical protein